MTGAAPAGHRRADLVLLAVTAAWGTTFPAIKIAVAVVPPLLFLAARFLLVFLGLVFLFRRTFFTGWRGRHREGFTLGLLTYASYAFQATGLQYTTASRSAFITGLSVSLVPLLYWPFRRRLPGLWPSIGAIACVAGLVLLTRPDLGRLNTGDIMTFGTTLAYAFYVILLESFTVQRPSEPLIGLQTFYMLIFSLLGWPLLGRFTAAAHPAASLRSIPEVVALFTGSPPALLGLAVTVPVAMLTMYGLTQFQKRTTAPRAGVIYSAEPVFAHLFAALWLGERLDGSGLAGAGLILLGMLAAVLS